MSMSRRLAEKRTENTNPILSTVVAGLVSTTAMTVLMQGLFNRLPRDQQYPLPPEEIATVAETSVLGKELSPPQHMAWTLISHFGYCITLAGVYSMLAEPLPFSALLKGVLYGIAVWAGSYLGWLPALGVLRPATQFPPKRNGLMIVAHLVWGAVLSITTDKF